MRFNIWQPNPIDIQKTNVFQSMKNLGFDNYKDFWKWSVNQRANFWSYVIETLEIPFYQKPTEILNTDNGVENAHWLVNAKTNIVEACFRANLDDIAIIQGEENGKINQFTYRYLLKKVNQIANSIQNLGLQKGDTIAVDLPMTFEAVAIYLAVIKAGMVVSTIADSFTPEEIKVRLEISQPKLIFTQDFLFRNQKQIPLYEKVASVSECKIIVISASKNQFTLHENDLLWDEFLIENDEFEAVICDAYDTHTLLFSSGTTSTPKAIPWTHITPIKCASDGYFHQDIQEKNVVAWHTNLGWMMGPWLVFATLINKGTIALFNGTPLDSAFGQFIEKTKVNMLGVVPSIVKQWKTTGCMNSMKWDSIKCFSSTGEASNAEDYSYLMQLGGNKPIIEYCGGTEIGGGYLCSTLIQNNIPSSFSTKTLGSDFVILDENHKETNLGEVFIIPPTLGLSSMLLNKNHHEEYYEGIAPFEGKTLRRHGDQIEQLENGYFKAQGRVDDAMNLGGIKVSSVQIEEVLLNLDFIKENAAISVPPKDGGPENLVIYYVLKNGINENKEEDFQLIANLVKTKINPLFKVWDVVAIQSLPRTASGKVMRRVLRKQYQEQNR